MGLSLQLAIIFLLRATAYGKVYVDTNILPGLTCVLAEDSAELPLLDGRPGVYVQSCLNRSNYDWLDNQNAYDCVPWSYYRACVAAYVLYENEPTSFLILGMGGGTVARAFTSFYGQQEGFTMDLVDLFPEMFEFAEKHLEFHPSGATKYHVIDALKFVDETVARNNEGNGEPTLYDFILVDIFEVVKIPPAFLSRAFYRSLLSLLRPNGIVVQNLVKTVEKKVMKSLSGLEDLSIISMDLLNGFNQVVYFKKGQWPEDASIRESWKRHRLDWEKLGPNHPHTHPVRIFLDQIRNTLAECARNERR